MNRIGNLKFKIINLLLIIMTVITLSSCSEKGYTEEKTYNLIDKYIAKLMKKSEPGKPAWNIEVTNSNRIASWNYIDGCMISSLLDLYNQTGEKKYYNFSKDYIDFYVSDNGSISRYDKNTFNLDNINEGRVLFELYETTKDEKYRLAIENLYEQLVFQPRTQEGNFWHKQIYRNQIWLDGLYMAQPFYTMYETKFNNKENYQDILSQFNNVYDLMYDKEKHLYYHGYDSSKSIFWADKETGLSKNFWIRAIGWYTIALVDVYSLIEDETIKTRFKELIEITLSGIYEYIDEESNMFYQVVDQGAREGNYLETSGSLMISYASLKAARLGAIDSKYQELGKNVFHGVCKKYLTNVKGDLNLGGICITAGLGPENNTKRDGSFEYYISEEVVENDAKGVAPLVMAYTELKKLK